MGTVIAWATLLHALRKEPQVNCSRTIPELYQTFGVGLRGVTAISKDEAVFAGVNHRGVEAGHLFEILDRLERPL
jgi:hypothetical protein